MRGQVRRDLYISWCHRLSTNRVGVNSQPPRHNLSVGHHCHLNLPQSLASPWGFLTSSFRTPVQDPNRPSLRFFSTSAAQNSVETFVCFGRTTTNTVSCRYQWMKKLQPVSHCFFSACAALASKRHCMVVVHQISCKQDMFQHSILWCSAKQVHHLVNCACHVLEPSSLSRFTVATVVLIPPVFALPQAPESDTNCRRSPTAIPTYGFVKLEN